MPRETIKPGDDAPRLFTPESFRRHSDAASYALGAIRTNPPFPGRGRFPHAASGAWGILRAGNSVSAASGVTLGTGSVDLCEADGTAFSPTEAVTVLNAGPAITATADKILPLEWTAGDWSVCECGGGGTINICGCTGVSTALTFTDSAVGSGVMTMLAPPPIFSFRVTLNYTYPGWPGASCNGFIACPGKVVPITYTFTRSGFLCLIEISFPTGGTSCPDPAGGGFIALFQPTITCSPFQALLTLNSTTQACEIENLYRGGSFTWTITP
jgi:hypothetical protein